MLAAPVLPGRHDHVITFATTTGSQWLWVLVFAGVLTATAAAMLRPVVPDSVAPAHLVVAVAALGVGLLLLLLAPGLALPRQLVGVLVIAMGVAVATARHLVRDFTGPTGPGAQAPAWLRPVRLVAPAVVMACAVGAAVALLSAWLSPSGVDVGPLVFTGLFLGVVGLSWLVVCGPRSRPLAVAVHGTGWVLAQVVLGATTVTALAALPA